jgi:hypothetical protein
MNWTDVSTGEVQGSLWATYHNQAHHTTRTACTGLWLQVRVVADNPYHVTRPVSEYTDNEYQRDEVGNVPTDGPGNQSLEDPSSPAPAVIKARLGQSKHSNSLVHPIDSHLPEIVALGPRNKNIHTRGKSERSRDEPLELHFERRHVGSLQYHNK